MTRPQKIFLYVGGCAVALFAVGAAVLRFDDQPAGGVRAVGDLPAAPTRASPDDNQTTPVPLVALAPAAQQKLDGMDASDKESVRAFLADVRGPLDNYLLNLEGMTNVANARCGEPDRAAWARALPIARVLEEGMCDCAQRNWLNQFIILGEIGLAGDSAKYHAQGEVMAAIGRFNGDSVDKKIVTTGGG